MKNYLITSLLFLTLGFSQKEYNYNDFIKMDNGLWTVKFSDEPITGKVYGYFGEVGNPKKVWMGKVLNGKKEGKWVSYYHSTGRKKYEENYKDGEYDGKWTDWYENGQKKIELYIKYTETIFRKEWNEDGSRKEKKGWNEDGSRKE